MHLSESHHSTPSLTNDLEKKQASAQAQEQRDFLRTSKVAKKLEARVESVLNAQDQPVNFSTSSFLDLLIRLNPILVTDLRLAEADNFDAAKRLDATASVIAERLRLIFLAQAKDEEQLREVASELYNLAIPNEDIQRLVGSMEIAPSEFESELEDQIESGATQAQAQSTQ